MTPHEISLCAEVYNERMIDESLNQARLCLMNAYYIEVFRRTEKLKNLSYYMEEIENAYKLSNRKESDVLTPDQMFNQVKALNALYGGSTVYLDGDGNKIEIIDD